MPQQRLLFSFAHPDDEAFGSGGAIARYVAAGAEVYYICATNGDVGTVDAAHLNGYNSVSELRLAELDKASAILGFKEVFKLGYKDSGMMGSDTAKDPASLWDTSQRDLPQITRRVVEIIRQVRPQVIVTFNKYGGYGHPDHIAIQRATTEAFHLAGDASYVTGQPAYQPQKLYYTQIPAIMIRIGVAIMRLRRQNPRQMGRNKDIDVLAILENLEPTHTHVRIAEYYDIWTKASEAHASQYGGGGLLRLPTWLRQMLAPNQGFTRVIPVPAYNRVDETDLFAGVRLD
jgi:LmbE family N-acetylglucosaminyl deacetylase